MVDAGVDAGVEEVGLEAAEAEDPGELEAGVPAVPAVPAVLGVLGVPVVPGVLGVEVDALPGADLEELLAARLGETVLGAEAAAALGGALLAPVVAAAGFTTRLTTLGLANAIFAA